MEARVDRTAERNEDSASEMQVCVGAVGRGVTRFGPATSARAATSAAANDNTRSHKYCCHKDLYIIH